MNVKAILTDLLRLLQRFWFILLVVLVAISGIGYLGGGLNHLSGEYHFTQGAFIRIYDPVLSLLGLAMLALGILALVAVYGLFRRRRWSFRLYLVSMVGGLTAYMTADSYAAVILLAKRGQLELSLRAAQLVVLTGTLVRVLFAFLFSLLLILPVLSMVKSRAVATETSESTQLEVDA